jgi:hypothetical protein
VADTGIALPLENADRIGPRAAPAAQVRFHLALWTLLVVCAVSFVATFVATSRYGIGLTPDSFVYLNGARNLADGHGYISDGTPITAFAPGYSAVLAVGDRLGLAVETGARILAAVSFVATVLLGYALLRRHVRSERVVALGTVAIGCSAVLLQIYREALSEHLFVVVVLLFVLAAEECMKAPRRLAPVVALVVLAWCAFYLRYAGIVFVPIAALVVVIAGWSRGRGAAIARAAAVLVAGVAVPALWMKRNVDAGSGLLGGRQDAAASPLTNVSRTTKELAGWLATGFTPGTARVLVVAAVAALVAAVVTLLLQRRIVLPDDTREIVPLVLVVGVYVTYLTVTASLVAFGPIQTRFLAPVFVPCVVLGAWFYEQVRRQATGTVRKAITVAAVVWLAISLAWFGGRVVNSLRNGAGGYATKRWHQSKTIDEVRKLDPSTPVYANDTVAIHLFADRDVDLSVQRTFFESNQETGHLPDFIRKVRCAGHVDLVWFLPNNRPRLYTPEQLAEHLRVVPRIEHGDGVIYEVSPLPGDRAAPGQC